MDQKMANKTCGGVTAVGGGVGVPAAEGRR